MGPEHFSFIVFSCSESPYRNVGMEYVHIVTGIQVNRTGVSTQFQKESLLMLLPWIRAKRDKTENSLVSTYRITSGVLLR